MKANKSVLKALILIIGGIGITFSGLNWHIGITAWFAPILLLFYTRNTNRTQFLLFFLVVSITGAVSQTGNNLLNLAAVHVFNGLSFGIFYSLPFIIDKLLYKKSSQFYFSLIFPVSVALVEFIVSLVIGTWGSIAHTQYEFNLLMQISSITGIYGIWFLVAWFASAVNWVLENKNDSRRIFKGVFIFGGIFILVLLYGVLRIKSETENQESVKTALVLSDNNIIDKINKEAKVIKELASNSSVEIPARIFSDSLTIETLLLRTKKAANNGAKIISWNEGALIVNQGQKSNIILKVKAVCTKNQAYVLISFLEECTEPGKKPFNNISVLISPAGEVIWEYKKSFLQPTAEAPIINAGNYELPTIETQYGKIGNVICADLDMNHYIKQSGKKSVDILLVPSFDWAGITPLHSQMASIEAIQYGVSVVRANGNGISAVYDYYGKEIASLNTFTSNEKILYAKVPVESVSTLYSNIGNIFIFLCLAFLVFIVAQKIFTNNK